MCSLTLFNHIKDVSCQVQGTPTDGYPAAQGFADQQVVKQPYNYFETDQSPCLSLNVSVYLRGFILLYCPQLKLWLHFPHTKPMSKSCSCT